MLIDDKSQSNRGVESDRATSFQAVGAALHAFQQSLSQLALALEQQLVALERQRDEAFHALDRVDLAISLIDQHSSLVHANEQSWKLLYAPKGLLGLRNGRIVARHSMHQAIFKRFLNLSSESTDIAQYRNNLLLRSDDAAVASLSISMVPSSHRTARRDASSLYVLAARSLAANDDIAACSRQLFNLTESEAQIASLMASGLSLVAAAEHQNIRVTTARTHLSRIFQKTGTEQQSQLVSLLRDAVLPIHRWSRPLP